VARHARRLAPVLGGLLALAVIGAAWSWQRGEPAPQAPPIPPRSIGLFTTLPILWNESGSVSDLIGDKAPPHWALAVVRRHGPVIAVDRLGAGQGPQDLARLDVLVMAQPRPLSPDENVALDDWVRGGGQVLLLVDPMLTQDSRFSPGDPRRPHDIAMLSPILARWGLRLTFDEAQVPGDRMVDVLGQALPVNLAGQFEPVPGDGACRIEAGGLLARCVAGKGRVTAFADAALLEREHGHDGPVALEALISAARH
jgi:hypothetical protein